MKLPAGASGEIVKDAMSPILPISPRLYPGGGATVKEPGKPNLQRAATTSQALKGAAAAAAASSSDNEMTALDLGDAALKEK